MEQIFATNDTGYTNIVRLIGFWSSLFITILGTSYFFVILLTIITGNLKLPPPEFVQIYAAIIDLLLCPAIIILIASIFYTVPKEKKIFAQIALIFSSIFTVMVTVNRFIQLTVVRLSVNAGDLEGLSRLYPYESHSVMFALELFGFGFFLSIALFFVAMSLSSGSIQRKAKYTFIIYAVLGFICIFGYIFDSLITNVGFIAWGIVLYIGTGFLSVFFYKNKLKENDKNK